MRVIEKYYSRIRLQRLAELVGVSRERAESEICDMVVNKRVSAKINRLEGLVQFSRGKGSVNERLQGWNKDIKTTLDTIEYTCHLIDRNIMESKKK